MRQNARLDFIHNRHNLESLTRTSISWSELFLRHTAWLQFTESHHFKRHAHNIQKHPTFFFNLCRFREKQNQTRIIIRPHNAKTRNAIEVRKSFSSTSFDWIGTEHRTAHLTPILAISSLVDYPGAWKGGLVAMVPSFSPLSKTEMRHLCSPARRFSRCARSAQQDDIVKLEIEEKWERGALF